SPPIITYRDRHHRTPHSFPTRRSSDLNQFHGPSFVNLDMSVSKRMKIWESASVELRLEAYNVMNHPNFNNPGDDPAGIGNQINKDRKSTRLNSSHLGISYAVFCLKKKK